MVESNWRTASMALALAATAVGCTIGGTNEGDSSGSLGVSAPEPRRVARISAAAATTCALRTDGTVACWGGAYAATPQEIAGVGDAVELEVGADLACVLRGRGGGVACWSLAGKGGPGSLAEVPGLDDAVSLSVGATHACSLLRGGGAACWGSNFDGQLGDGTEHDAPTPVRVAGLARALEITAGDFATCARLEDGSVRCWGRSYAGQLGDALFTHAACADESCSVSSVAVAGLDDALEIAAGLNGACARRSDGHVVAWGWNHAGELGDGALVDRAAPAEVLGLDDAIRVYAGYVRKCALRASGELACWGALPGTGVSEPVLAATNVEGLHDVVDVTGGWYHLCALDRAGVVVCWGDGEWNQLGPASSQQTKVVVEGL